MLCVDAWGTLAERRTVTSGHYSSGLFLCGTLPPDALSGGKNLRFPQVGQLRRAQLAVVSASRAQLSVHRRKPVVVALARSPQRVFGVDVALPSQADRRQQQIAQLAKSRFIVISGSHSGSPSGHSLRGAVRGLRVKADPGSALLHVERPCQGRQRRRYAVQG